MRISIAYLCIIASLLVFSCRDSPNEVNWKSQKVDFQAYDFYRDFQKIDTTHTAQSLDELEEKYPSFLNFYLDTLMGIGSMPPNDSLCRNVSMILNHENLRFLADTINIVYPNTSAQTEEIEKLYKHIKYYYKEWLAPDIYYFDGGLRLWQVVSYKDFLGIGLDMFLGENFPYYASRQVPSYMNYSFGKQQIPIQCGKVIFSDLYFTDLTGSDFLAMIIQSGKQILFLSYMVPQMPENEYFSMPEDKYTWMPENEAEIYNFFINKNMLYSTDYKDNVKYIIPASSSPGMPINAPGQTGTFIGYRILQKYMKETGSSLRATLDEKDYQKIFQKSRYKPH